MSIEKVINLWKKDQKIPFKGWDFSYLKNRMVEEKTPWNYTLMAKRLVRQSNSLLDMGTGGGEIFSKLAPFPKNTFATEGYKPNIPIARKRLKPLNVKVVDITKNWRKLPFENDKFDLVLNRHEAFDAKEVYRILKKNGSFLTQQVGRNNTADLVGIFRRKSKYKAWTLHSIVINLKKAGFKIKYAKEWKGKVIFKDVGAVVYFIKAVPWSVNGFSIKKDIGGLIKLQKKLKKEGRLVFAETRYVIKARK